MLRAETVSNTREFGSRADKEKPGSPVLFPSGFLLVTGHTIHHLIFTGTQNKHRQQRDRGGTERVSIDRKRFSDCINFARTFWNFLEPINWALNASPADAWSSLLVGWLTSAWAIRNTQHNWVVSLRVLVEDSGDATICARLDPSALPTIWQRALQRQTLSSASFEQETTGVGKLSVTRWLHSSESETSPCSL